MYEDEINLMSCYIDDLTSTLRQTNSEVTKKLSNLIESNNSMTKKELFGKNLGWGRGIKFGAYRRALLNHPNIYDVIDAEPEYFWKSFDK